ncbi:GNAT family N-acetyltransferase [Bacillus sp. JJ664]
MHISKQWVKEDSDFIRNKVIEYNLSLLPEEVKQSSFHVSHILKNDAGEIVGGITGKIFWNHLHIDYLWVEDSLRDKGYGGKLLHQIEKTAIENNCRLILLDTFSFQAPDFYLKQGFKVVGIVEDHPKGCKQYFLEKKLTRD